MYIPKHRTVRTDGEIARVPDRAFHASLQSAPAAHPHAAFEQHRTAAAKFTAATNALARRHALADNALYRQRQADLAAVSQLVKNAGGSIEITN